MKVYKNRVNVRKGCAGYYLRWYYNGWHYWWFLPGTESYLSDGEKYRTLGTRRVAMSSGQVTRDEAQAIRTVLNTIEISILTDAGWKAVRIDRSSVVVYDSRIAGAEIDFIAIIGSRDLSGTGYSPSEYIPPVPPVLYEGFGMLYNQPAIIGLIVSPPINYTGYGALYNWWVASLNGGTGAGSVAPAGWHVPTDNEQVTLRLTLDPIGDSMSNVAGGMMKEIGTTYWNAPNTGASNSSGFNAKGSGSRSMPSGNFTELLTSLFLWSCTNNDATTARRGSLSNTQERFLVEHWSMTKGCGASIRCLKDDSIDPGTVIDVDGNIYETVTIGTQVWMNASLKVTKFNDGTPIPEEQNDAAWAALSTPAYCWYNNTPS